MTEFLHTLHMSLVALLQTHFLLVTGSVIFVEELGVPIPLPGDLVMLLSGVRIARGEVAWWAVILVEEGATVGGASLLFAASRRFGRSFVLAHGRWLHLGPNELERAESAVLQHGGRAVLLGRLVPGLRIVTVIAAGALGMPFVTFLPALAIGGLCYLSVYTIIGILFGPAVVALYNKLALPASAILSFIVLAFMAFVIHGIANAEPSTPAARRPTIETTLLTGVVAGVTALLVVNVLLGLLTVGARLLGNSVPLATHGAGNDLRLLTGWPVFLLAAAAMSLLYGLLRMGRLPPPVGTVLIAGIPLALTLAIVDPVADGWRSATVVTPDLVVAMASVVRWVAFGLTYVTLLPLLTRLRH